MKTDILQSESPVDLDGVQHSPVATRSRPHKPSKEVSPTSTERISHHRVIDLSDGLQEEEHAVAGVGIAATSVGVESDPWDDVDEVLLTREEMDFVDSFTSSSLSKRLGVSTAAGRKEAMRAHANVFAGLGLDYHATADMLRAWATISPAHCSHEERTTYFTECIRTLKELRAIDPKYPALAHTMFGIRHFGRYSAAALARQIDVVRSGKPDRPLIVVAESVNDYNNAGYTEGYRPMEVYGPMEDSGDFHVLYTEAVRVGELVDTTINLSKRAEASISGLFISGHGSKKALEIGNHKIHRDDPESLDRLKRIYDSGVLTPGAELILVSCSVGARNGLAQTLAKLTQRHVIASPRPILLNPLERLQKGVYKLSYAAQHGVLRLFEEYDFGGIRYGKRGRQYSRVDRPAQALRLHD